MSGNPSNVVITNGGLEVKDGCKFGIKIPKGSPLYTNQDGLNINLTPQIIGNGLQEINNVLSVKPTNNGSINVDSSGVNIKTATTSSGLETTGGLAVKTGPGMKITSGNTLVPDFSSNLYSNVIFLKNESESGFNISTNPETGNTGITYTLPVGYQALHFTTFYFEMASDDNTATINDSCELQGFWSSSQDTELYGYVSGNSTGVDIVIPQGFSNVKFGISGSINTTQADIQNTLTIKSTLDPSSSSVLFVGYYLYVFILILPYTS